mgnify:CR=1 FL=1
MPVSPAPLTEQPRRLCPLWYAHAGQVAVGLPIGEIRFDQLQHLGLADTVVFAGFRSDVAELLRAADAYVQPSRWEGFPLTLLEAMQAERPVVATEGAGRPAGFVDGTHGYIVPTGDSTGLAKAITMVLQATPLQRMEMGRANGALVRANYRIDDVRRRSADALEGLVGGPSTRPAEHIAE